MASQPSAATPIASGTEQTPSPIPGPRTCFWFRGPFSADPYLNIAYPDASVFYWSAGFTVPRGASLSIEGDFAHARYQSFISYDAAGKPMEALADYLIKPVAGATNPFQAGADRNAARRGYAISILDGADNLDRMEGKLRPGATRNTLHAPKYGPGTQTILYRIYRPDANAPVTGGVPLPEPVLTLANGRVLRGEDACRALNTRQQPQLSPSALGIPIPKYRELTRLPGKPDTWPATVDPTWHIQLDRPSLLGIYTGDINPNARRSEGGFYPNPDNNYIRTIINLRHGPVLVMRGKMPTTPRTHGGDARMGDGQVRYWSMCSNQGFVNTRVTDCLFDEEVPLDAAGNYTVVISKAKDRPRNARPECGIAWLQVADDGDGLSDPDVAVIQIRNLLAAPGFAQAIQNAETDAKIAETMGEYMPKSSYTMPNVVETLFPCPL